MDSDIEIDKINYALTIFNKNGLINAVKVYCVDLEDEYNDEEIELIVKSIEECISIIKELINEIKNKNLDEKDIYYGILALKCINNCYGLVSGYIQEHYTNVSVKDRNIRKKNICNLIIYLAINFGSENPYDDLLKKIWEEQGDNILEGIMIIKNWTKNTIENVSKCCF